MILFPEDVIKLLLAILLGGLIGAEREFRDKAAGFRTIIFITLGATLFTVLSVRLGGEGDAVRIAANIVTGVGFLGAGAILRDGGRVTGLTTASTIWLAAALGMGIGGGQYLVTLIGTGLVICVLAIFPKFEYWIDNLRDTRTYEVTVAMGSQVLVELEDQIRRTGLRVVQRRCQRRSGEVMCAWTVYGSPHKHDELAEKLIAHVEVKEFKA